MEQSCKQCGTAFEIIDADLAFYDKVSPVFNGKKEPIPPPSLCPECRDRRRFAFRNERSLYRRMCNICQQPLIAIYPATTPFKVLCPRCYHSDRWDVATFGREADMSKSFFEQWQELRHVVPCLGIDNFKSENCEYCQDFAYGKNCYLCVGCWYLEDALYTRYSDHSRNVVDGYYVIESELCYECTNVPTVYRSAFLTNSEQCTDCVFGEDLKGCASCIGCIGLRQKKHHVLNRPVSPAEYERFRARYLDGTAGGLRALREQFEVLKRTHPRPAAAMTNCENCTGHGLSRSQDTLGFYCYNAEHSRFVDLIDTPVWTYDVFLTGRPRFCYEGITPDDASQCMATISSWDTHESFYCTDCYHCTNCFGCIGLKRAQYCILNKQYTKEEYETLVPKIIEKMRADGEWGEFFPVTMSPFAYNETVAQEYFPLTKEEVLARGWRWRDQTDDLPKVDRIIPADQLPDAIDDIPDDILNWAIECEATKRPFKIIRQELDFYRTMRLPLPHFHPDERHRRRMALRNPRKLWQRECAKCQKPIATSYAPERPEIVYCESCYLASVY